MAESFHKLLDQIILFLPRLITGLLIFLGFWLLAILVEKIVKRLIRRVVSYQDIQLILQRGIKGTILAIGIATSLGTIGINISAMIAGLGLTGFALGFAFKDMLSNTLAGILIIINRPFVNGDYINTSGLEGKVIEINLRYVILKKDDKKY